MTNLLLAVFITTAIFVIWDILTYQARDGLTLSVPLICRLGCHFPVVPGGWEDDRCGRCGEVL